MFQGRFIEKFWTMVFLGIGVFSLNGCAEKPLPPVFNLYGYQRIAVIPFDNQTQDPALAKATQDEFTEEILGLNAVPMVEAASVAAYLKSLQADPSALETNDDLRRKVAQKFQCDLFLMGTTDGYNEFLKDEAPCRGDNGSSKWGFYTDRKVVTHVSAKLMDPATGSLVWSKKNQGWSYYNTWNPLPNPEGPALPPPFSQLANIAGLFRHRVLRQNDYEPALDQNDPSVLLYPRSSYFADLREKALTATVEGIVEDFRGNSTWTPDLKGNSPAQ